VIALALSAALLAVFAPGVNGATGEPVTGGKTVLKTDPEALRNLGERGVTAGIIPGAASVAGGVRFPIDGGELREGPRGTVEHAGGLSFRRSAQPEKSATLELTDFTIRFGAARAKLYAASAGSEVRFFDLDLSNAAPPRNSDNPLRLKHIEATLAGPAAKLMTEELGVAFHKGDPAGNLNLKPLTGDKPKEDQ
jgi:hypothetical protein